MSVNPYRSYAKRHRGTTDGPHGEIKRALQARGWLVLDLAEVGGGVPDLLAVHEARHVFLEVKAAKGAVSELQAQLHATLRAAGAEVYVVRSALDVRALVDTAQACPSARETGPSAALGGEGGGESPGCRAPSLRADPGAVIPDNAAASLRASRRVHRP